MGTYSCPDNFEKDLEEHIKELDEDVIARATEEEEEQLKQGSKQSLPKTKKSASKVIEVCNDILGIDSAVANKTSFVNCCRCFTLDIPLYTNKRFQRAFLIGMSLMLAFVGYLGFIYEYIEYDPPVIAWVPGIISVVGLVSMNLVSFPDPEDPRYFTLDTQYSDGRMSIAEIYFVVAMAGVILPLVVSVFVMIVDYNHEKEHTVGLAVFFQTLCMAIASFALMGARSMHIRPAKKDDSFMAM